MDTLGNAAIAWRHTDADGRSRVWITRRDAGGGASLPTGPVSATGQDVLAMDIAVSGGGDLFVAWHARGADGPVVCLTRLAMSAQHWAPTSCLLAPRADGMIAFSLATDAVGGAAVVWSEAGALMVSRFDASRRQWSVPGVIAEAHGRITSAQVRLDQDANPFVVWRQAHHSARGTLFSSRFDPGVARWTAPSRVDPGSEADQCEPRLAIGTDGRATVVWLRRQGATSELMAVRHDAVGRRFGPALRIDVDAGSADLAVDGRGNAAVTWTQVKDDVQTVRVRRFLSSKQSEDEAVTVGTGALYTMRDPSIALDSRGGVMVVWSQLHDVVREHVLAARFDAHRGSWMAPVRIGEQARGFGTVAKVALASQGAGLAAWAGYGAVRANTFR